MRAKAIMSGRAVKIDRAIRSGRCSARRKIGDPAGSHSDFRRQSNAGTWPAIPCGWIRTVAEYVESTEGQAVRTWPQRGL